VPSADRLDGGGTEREAAVMDDRHHHDQLGEQGRHRSYRELDRWQEPEHRAYAGRNRPALKAVADAAGFSKGAVYSNFGTKDALCQAVIEAVRAEQFQAIADAFRAGGPAEDRLKAFEAWAEQTIGDPGWTLLEAEFAIHACRRDPDLRATVVEGGRAAAAMLRGLLEEELRVRPRTLPIPVEEAIEALLGLGVGLGLRRAVDPDLSPAPSPT
jgi:AcrR family transcriptional regulator